MYQFICSFQQPSEVIIVLHFTVGETEMLVPGRARFEPRQPISIEPVLLFSLPYIGMSKCSCCRKCMLFKVCVGSLDSFWNWKSYLQKTRKFSNSKPSLFHGHGSGMVDLNQPAQVQFMIISYKGKTKSTCFCSLSKNLAYLLGVRY